MADAAEQHVTIVDDNAATRVTVVDPVQDGTNVDEVPHKKKKKKKLTKAEKKALKLQKMLDFKKLELRDKLERELIYSKKSADKSASEWEEICRDIKILEMREELQYCIVKSRRVLEEKDAKIKLFLDDIDTTMEMQKRGFERHVLIMNYITDVYTTLLETAKFVYESQSSEAIQDFFEEINTRETVAGDRKLNCENIMHATNMVLEQKLFTDHKIYLEKQDDRVNTEIERRYQLRDKVILDMKSLQNQLLDFVHALKSATLDPFKYERIQLLTDRQRAFLEETQKLNDVEFKLSKQYGDLQRDLLQVEVDGQRRISDLKLEQGYFLQVRKGIEQEMTMDRMNTFEKIRRLTSDNYETVEKCKKSVKYGELLLSLSATCRKLMTEREKVVSEGSFKVPKDKEAQALFDYDYYEEEIPEEESEQDFKLQTLELSKHVDLTEEELISQVKLLKNFWRRQSTAQMQNILLAEEKRQLLAENEKYCNFIRLMSKTDRADELLEAIHMKCVMPESTPPCISFKRQRQLQREAEEEEKLRAEKIAQRQSSNVVRRSSVPKRRSSASEKRLSAQEKKLSTSMIPLTITEKTGSVDLEMQISASELLFAPADQQESNLEKQISNSDRLSIKNRSSSNRLSNPETRSSKQETRISNLDARSSALETRTSSIERRSIQLEKQLSASEVVLEDSNNLEKKTSLSEKVPSKQNSIADIEN